MGRLKNLPPDIAFFSPKACPVTASSFRKLKKTVKKNLTPRGIKIDGFEHFTEITAFRRRGVVRHSIFPHNKNVDKYPMYC